MSVEKRNLNVVVCGHVDNGKSTLIGRLLEATGSIPQHLIEKYKKESEQSGKGSFGYAWVMDSLPEERERGVTIDIAHKKFQTKNFSVTIIDAPGHKDFIKNMITGTSQADLAILVVDANKAVNAAEVQPQMKEHALLCKGLGVEKMIVAINKMDEVDYKQDMFNKACERVEGALKPIGITKANTPFIPVVAYEMGNLTERFPKFNWWKGSTLIEEIDKFKLGDAPSKRPLRLCLQDVYTITGIGTVAVGRIETGILRPKQKIVSMPSGKVGEIKSIEMHHQQIQEGMPGDNVGANISGISKSDLGRGCVIGETSNPPKVAKSFIAEVIILNHPGVLVPGYTPVFHTHTAQVSCTFTKLLRTLDNKKQPLAENPPMLKMGNIAEVEITPTQPLVIEDDFHELSRFAIRDMGVTIGIGRCIKTIEKEKKSK